MVMTFLSFFSKIEHHIQFSLTHLSLGGKGLCEIVYHNRDTLV